MDTVGEQGDVLSDWMFRYRPVDEITAGSEGGKGRPGSRDRILLHHYATRSRSEYVMKLGRGEMYWEDMKGALTWECREMVEYSRMDRS